MLMLMKYGSLDYEFIYLGHKSLCLQLHYNSIIFSEPLSISKMLFSYPLMYSVLFLRSHIWYVFCVLL